VTRTGIVYQPLWRLVRDLSDWIVRTADIIIMVAAFELARQLSGSQAMEWITYIVRIAAAVVIVTDIWRKSDEWLDDEAYRRGLIKFAVLPFAWLLPIAVLSTIGIGGPLDDVVEEIARSLK
jgi:chromate transport protein ChrA